MTTEERIERLADAHRSPVSLAYDRFNHIWAVRIASGHDVVSRSGHTAAEALTKAEHMSGIIPPE